MFSSLYKTGDLGLLNIACCMFFCWNQWNLEISATLWKPNVIRYPHGRHGASGYTAPACRTHGRSSIPEKLEALYVLVCIHMKMTLEELVQQAEAMFTSIQGLLHTAYSDVAVSTILSFFCFTIMVQRNRLSAKGSFFQGSLSNEKLTMFSRDAVQFVSSPFWKSFCLIFFPLNFTSMGLFSEGILFLMVHCFFLLWKMKEASLEIFLNHFCSF